MSNYPILYLDRSRFELLVKYVKEISGMGVKQLFGQICRKFKYRAVVFWLIKRYVVTFFFWKYVGALIFNEASYRSQLMSSVIAVVCHFR